MAKYVLGVPFVEVLGYLVSAEGLEPLPFRVDAILNYKKPETRAELHRFLGIVNFDRIFVERAAHSQVTLL